MVDFTTLHPIDFDRNLFNFLVCILFSFSVMCSSISCKYRAVFVSPIGLVFLLLMAFLYFKLVTNYAVHIRSPTHACMHACSAYEPRPHLFVDLYGGYNYLASAEW